MGKRICFHYVTCYCDIYEVTIKQQQFLVYWYQFCQSSSTIPTSFRNYNSIILIILGACEAVLESLKISTLIGGSVAGHLVQEGCRAMRHLCGGNKEGLERMHSLGVCTVLLGIASSHSIAMLLMQYCFYAICFFITYTITLSIVSKNTSPFFNLYFLFLIYLFFIYFYYVLLS